MSTFSKSDSIKNIAMALAGFHSNVGKVTKEATNPFFKNKYASLSNILDTIQTPLTESGLTFSQFPDGQHGLTTILIHTESGEFLQASFTMKPAKDDPQGIGSAITYARRYAIGAVLGLNIDDDDDGNEASGVGGKKAAAAPVKQQPVKSVDPLAKFQVQYATVAEIGSALMEAKTVKEVAALYTANEATITHPDNANLKKSFGNHRDQIKAANPVNA